MERKKHNPIIGILTFSGDCRKMIIISILLAIFGVLSGLLPYVAVSGILVSFTGQTATISTVMIWVAVFLAGGVFKSVLLAKSTLISHEAAFIIIANIREKIVDKLRRVPMGFLQNQPSGKLKMLIVDEVEKLEYPLAHAIPELTSNIIAPVVIFIILLFIHTGLAFVSLVTLPVGFLVSAVMMAGYKKRYDSWFASGENMNKTIVEYINGIEVIKAYNQTTSSFEKYNTAVMRYRDNTLAWFKANWLYSAAYAAILPSVLVATLPFGIWIYLKGSIELSSLILALILSLGLIPPIMKLIEFTDNLAVIIQTESKVNEMLTISEMAFPLGPVHLNNHDIELSNVSFSYNETPVLKDMSLTIRENTTTALVGASGSGKSTITKLIARSWDVNKGEITIGRQNIKHIPEVQLTGLISSVSQDIHLFDMSIEENIRIGNPSASEVEIRNVSKQAGCDDFINGLEKGYHTRVGESGERLSGGEKQRIAIARAILKDAPILLLDEATASIDAENEDKIQQSINSLAKNKTLIIVAHRLSTIIQADNIIVLSKGEIHAQGTHEELLKSSKLYQNMWMAHIDAGEWSLGRRDEHA